MALRASIYKAELTIADTDRGYYADHALTLARHPSETEERLMVRLLAFALNAGPSLAFGRGLSTEDEADLWSHDATGVLDLWIDVGLPEERWLRKACGRARRVQVLAYGERKVPQWWQQNAAAFSRLERLSVLALAPQDCAALSAFAARAMQLTCTVQDGHVWLASETRSAEITPQWLQRGRSG